MDGIFLRSSKTSSTSPNLSSLNPAKLHNNPVPKPKDTIDPPKKPATPSLFWRIVGGVVILPINGVGLLFRGGVYIVRKFKKENLDQIDKRCLKNLEDFEKFFKKDPFIAINTLLQAFLDKPEEAKKILLSLAGDYTQAHTKLSKSKIQRQMLISTLDGWIMAICFTKQMNLYDRIINLEVTEINGKEINNKQFTEIAEIHKKTGNDLYDIFKVFIGILSGKNDFSDLGKGLETVIEGKAESPPRTAGLLLEYVLQKKFSVRELLKLKGIDGFKNFADLLQVSIWPLLPPQVKVNWGHYLLSFFKKKKPEHIVKQFPHLEILLRKTHLLLSNPEKRNELHDIIVQMIGNYSPRTQKVRR